MEYLKKIDSPDDLKRFPQGKLGPICSEIRGLITDTVSKNGGHLSSNLGVVELTVALHYIFDSPKDKIIWDVGHQCYAHKILTGRRDRFHTIRKRNGLSGFPKSKESEHDHFDAGHASTSLSAGLGFAVARDLQNDKHHVICIIGDGALTGGMALEAINNMGYMGTRLIIILNDNKMSIGKNVGALAAHTSRISKTILYKKVRSQVGSIEKKVKEKKAIQELKKSLKSAGSPSFLFEKLGIDYLGPVDGHNLDEMIDILKIAKEYKGPVLIHIKTTKGKGYPLAEKDASRFHGIGKFDTSNGKAVACEGCSFTDVFGETITRLAGEDSRIVAVTAAMESGTGLTMFQKRFPDRIFDVGIAEQHAVTFCAGLAKNGLIPILPIYSTFLQRAYDQVLHDVCLQNLRVIFCIDRAGIVGEDGSTHHGAFDISYLRHMPNLTIASPKDRNELIQMIYLAPKMHGPLAIRYPKDGVSKELLDFTKKRMEIPSSTLEKKGNSGVIVAIGSMVRPAIDAAKKLRDISVINARFIKPIDRHIIRHIKKVGCGLIVEENAIKGGFGSAILEELSNGKEMPKLSIMGIGDRFVGHGSRTQLLQDTRLTTENIIKKFKQSF